MNENWDQLSSEEKREKRFATWLSTEGLVFNSPEAERNYVDRVKRFISVIKLEEPDRVPVMMPVGNLPLREAGITLKKAMYDSEKLIAAYTSFFHRFNKADNYASPMMIGSGKAGKIIKSLMNKTPGNGLPDDAVASQFVEGEYMMADEYDHLLNDPSDFILRRYLPRSMGALEPFQNFPPIMNSLGFPNMFLGPLSNPAVRESFKAMIEYGEEMEKWQKSVMKFSHMAQTEGFAPFGGGFCHAPFDLMGDTLRGTKGIIMDMYRQPDKLKVALDKMTTHNINFGLRSAAMSRSPIVTFPLHKGDDSFMSDEQYEKWYWPSFRKVIMALIDEGIVPVLFAEGKYNNRLKTIQDLPKGGVVWHFDRTDMFEAKKILGDTACIMGNVPTSLLITGQPAEVKNYCRELIETCGVGGGFILAGGASIDTGNPDNIQAMVDAAYEYGVY